MQTILLLDSNPHQRKIFKELTTKAGYDVLDFDGGNEAEDHLKDHKVEIAAIVSNHECGDNLGFDFYQKICEGLYNDPTDQPYIPNSTSFFAYSFILESDSLKHFNVILELIKQKIAA